MKRYIDEFKEHMSRNHKFSPNSIAAYCRDISNFLSFLAKKDSNSPDAIVQADIAAYMLTLKQSNRSGATINRKMASLRAFFRFLQLNSYISYNPSIGFKTPKAPKREIEYLTLEEVENLLAQPDDSIKGHRDKAILELMYATGLRVTEVIEANTEHLNLRMGFITCTGEFGKARIIPIGRPARAALEEYIYSYRPKTLKDGSDEKALFLNYNGGRLSRQSMWRLLRNYAASAGVSKKITPQVLRNSFAVHMLQNGADLKSLQELMGHEDVVATQAYLNVSRNHIKDVYDKSHPRA
jgi:integrase/recombinase XerD